LKKIDLRVLCVCVLLAQCTTGGSTSVNEGDTNGASSGPTTAWARGQATPVKILPNLQGAPLRDPTRLTLLIENTLVDIDHSKSIRIAGLPDPVDGDVVDVQTVDNQAVITYDHVQCTKCDPRIEVFDLAAGSKRAKRIATDVFVAPADHALWATRYVSETRCTLSLIRLDGRRVSRPRNIGCHLEPLRSTPLGLLALDQNTAENVILDPSDLHEIFRARRIHAVIGERVLFSDVGGFAIMDEKSGRVRRLAQPAAVGDPVGGEVSPEGRYVAIEFRDPEQFMDLWVLDLETLDWIHAPSMPVLAKVKRTGPLWACDGRLVLLGFFGAGKGSQTLVLWRPGEVQLAIREVRYPDGSFALRC
jgi:hypothetical protein